MNRYKEVLANLLGRFATHGTSAAYILIAAFVLTSNPLPACENLDTDSLLTGQWGGRGAELRFHVQGAELEFDCAFARIDATVRTNSAGEFFSEGFYLPEPGGPGRVGDSEPRGLPAIFTGVRRDSEIRLTIQLIEQDRSIGPFIVVKDQRADLEKCL